MKRISAFSIRQRFVNSVIFASILALGPAYPLWKSEFNFGQTPLKAADKLPYVLIGGGTASFSAMQAILEREPNATILIISEEEHVPYERPPLSKELWIQKTKDLTFTNWENKKKSIFYEPKGFFT